MLPGGNLRRLADHNLRKNAEVSRAKNFFFLIGDFFLRAGAPTPPIMKHPVKKV